MKSHTPIADVTQISWAPIPFISGMTRFGNFPAESSSVRYGEGLLMGYRWYEARHLPVLFPFGHGLSYTQVRVGPGRASSERLQAGSTLMVEVDVENVGERPGSEVVQLYVAPPGGGIRTPQGRLRAVKQLKGFVKVRLAPGEKQTVSKSVKEGGDQIEYEDQDPRIHAIWLEELRKSGVTPKLELPVRRP